MEKSFVPLQSQQRAAGFHTPVPGSTRRGDAGDAPAPARQPEPPQPAASLHAYDVTKRKDEVILQGINNYDLDKDGKKAIYRAGQTYGIVDAAPGKKVGDGRVGTAGLQARVDPREEWKQIFREA
jgi:tricorn protease